MKRLFLFLFVAVLSSCSVKLITPTQTDVDRVSGKYNGYTLTDLTAGKALYEQKCSQCHSLKDPSKQTEEQWTKLVPDMAHKSAVKPDVIKITDKDQDLILKYLVTMSTAPKPVK